MKKKRREEIIDTAETGINIDGFRTRLMLARRNARRALRKFEPCGHTAIQDRDSGHEDHQFPAVRQNST